MMKKVTIITPPEYEGLVLESLGRTRVTQLKAVTGSEFEGLRRPSKQEVDYKTLYKNIHAQYVELLGMGDLTVERVIPSVDDLRTFSNNPESEVDILTRGASGLIEKINSKKLQLEAQNSALEKEMEETLRSEKSVYETQKNQVHAKLQELLEEKEKFFNEKISLTTKLSALEALSPEDLKNCFAAGVIKEEYISNVGEYLKRYPETQHKTVEVSKEESLLFVFGSDESKEWVESLFLIYEINDIFKLLDKKTVERASNADQREKLLTEYKEKIKDIDEKIGSEEEKKKLEAEISQLDQDIEEKEAKLKEEYESKKTTNEEAQRAEVTSFQTEQSEIIGKMDYFVDLLRIFSKKNAPVLRGKVISVMQGYTPEFLIPDLKKAVSKVEEEIGEKLLVEFSDLDEDDHLAPTAELQMPGFLQPAWILTRLRGWPSANELNPGYIALFIFCFQFGLMFGDIGQGAIFMIIGLTLHKRFDKGMMKYLTALLIPMGFSAIVFGFMYDSIFLKEHLISNFIHEASIQLPFRYPLLPNPISEIGELMSLIFLIGTIEVVFGSLLGAYNSLKQGNLVGMIGEHGLGMGLYVIGLYLSAGSMFTEGLDVVGLVSEWPFLLMIAGMVLSFMEPVLHSLIHGHGIGVESIGEGIGGLMMTFIEGLANLFSFLRIAAFALAHASLATAAEGLGSAIGNTLLAFIIMNVIALTFEFVSSSVQSLRLLYYEFMGKFFKGEGVPFKPFRVRKA